MDSFVVDIDQEDKEDLIELVRRRFDSVEEISSATRIPYSNLVQHENGELENIGLQNLGDLLATVNLSDSRFRNSEPGELANKEFDYTPPRVELDDGLQEAVFRAFSVDEVDKVSDKSRQTVNRIRNSDSSRIPKPLYEEFFTRLDEELDRNIDFEAEVSFAGNGGKIMDADQEELLDLYLLRENFQELARERDQAREYIKSNVDLIPEILESDKTFFKSEGRFQSAFYNVLDDFGLMDHWGGLKNRYTKEAPDEYFKVLEHEIRNKIEDEEKKTYRTGELLHLLQSTSEDLEEPPTESFFDDDGDLPSANTYKTRFGSWNNALWRAGLETREHSYTEDELTAYVLEKYHEKGERPNRAEIDNDPEAPSVSAFENEDENYTLDDFMDDTGIPDVERMLDMRWYSTDQPTYSEPEARKKAV